MNKLYSTIPAPKLKRNSFSLSHRNYLTMSEHHLIPSMIKETLPGDIWKGNLETFARVQPLVSPILSSISISHHVFFVPMRTLNDNWEDFITGGREGTNTKVLPYTYLGDLTSLIYNLHNASPAKDDQAISIIRLLDYMGVPFKYPTNTTSKSAYVGSWISLNNPTFTSSQEPVNLLPFLAYQKIYDEYYRDQNLEASVIDSIESWMPKTTYGLKRLSYSNQGCLDLFTFRDRAWKKDRFTSALPFTQRGPEVYIPLAGSAPIVSDAEQASSLQGVVYSQQGPTKPGDFYIDNGSGADPRYIPVSQHADLDNAELQTTINNFRQAERLQSWYERDARGGARLNENNLAHWGVPTLDASLDRAEFLGGEHFPIVISEVEQNSATGSTGTPQGNLAGKASAYNNGFLFKRFTREHGYIIVLSSIMSQAIYSQGLDKMWSRQERIDYAWPEFAHLGEEPIYNKEVTMFHSTPNGVFGYTPRYSDYKSALSTVHGEFRGTLNKWLQQRNLATDVALSKEFVMSQPDDGIFAVSADIPTDQFLVVLNFGLRASRLLPFYGVPTL